MTEILAIKTGTIVRLDGAAWMVVRARYYRRSTATVLYDLEEHGAKGRSAWERKVDACRVAPVWPDMGPMESCVIRR